MTTRYLVRKEDNERICANIVAKLDELCKANRELIGQDSQSAGQAIEENWQYMRELEARLKDRKNPKIYKEIPAEWPNVSHPYGIIGYNENENKR